MSRTFASSGYQHPERLTNEFFIDKDLKYCAHNYKPLPIVLNRGEGIHVWDVQGKKYFDFLCGYSSNNQGHSHPKILKALFEQATKITQTSRAFCNDQMGETCEYLSGIMGYDKFLPMNTGVEATETAVKLARKWGYTKKGIPDNKAQVIMMEGNFWGRTITAAGACDDPSRYNGFGPFTPGFPLIPFDDIEAFRKMLEADKNVAAVMVEAIQGERGVIIPKAGYLKQMRELCTKHNVLMIIDEVQTGFGRTGKFMGYDWEGVKPDIVSVGKALSGGIMPVSGAFCNDEIMLCIKPGEHGSTYGGNPLAMAVAKAAIQTLIEEGMVENALAMGEVMGA